jgi:fructose-1,6-bisphosphatase/inositol monophosphatase family enzyme
MDREVLLKHLISMSENMARAAIEARERWVSLYRGKKLESLIDNASVEAFKNYIRERGLRFRVISEEGFAVGEGEGEFIIVDPVDGTSNLRRGIPFSSISLAVASEDNMDAVYIGVVRDIFRGSTYYAIRGVGAFKDGRRIRVSGGERVEESSISISITRSRCGESRALKILPQIPYPRYFGSAALEICLVEEGVLDAYIDVRSRLRVFDIAAAQLILREAGGAVAITQDGNRDVRLTRVGGVSIVAAATEKLLRQILRAIS